MAIAVVSATRQGDSLAIEVCPAYGPGCACPTPGRHAVYHFRALPPDGRTEAEWAAGCAREALLLVAAAQQALQGQQVPGLKGMTL